MDIQEIKDQINRIKLARAKLNAEILVGRAMLPDKVIAACHYDGKQRGIEENPKYRELIEEIYGY